MEREALVAQGADKKARLCDRCFASVPPTEAFCPECGAAITDSGGDQSDAAVYPELARANLLRMRGDYKVAEEQCLSILRRYPNNATANILLGDISAEKGDLEQAMQWYELAIDLVPDSTAASHKLNQVRERFKAQETAATVEQLGLPTTKSRAGVYAVALIASIFVIAVVAYLLGQRVEQKSNGVQPPIVAGRGTNGSDITPKSGGTTTGGGVARTNAPREDQELLDALKNRSANGGRVISAMQDPRTKVMNLTFSALEGEDVRTLGAQIARDAFQEVADALVITLRGMRRGQLVYAADAMRSRYEETLTSTWREANSSDPDAWIAHILSNEWQGDSQNQEPGVEAPQGQEQGDGTQPGSTPPPGEQPGVEEPEAEQPAGGEEEVDPGSEVSPPGEVDPTLTSPTDA